MKSILTIILSFYFHTALAFTPSKFTPNVVDSAEVLSSSEKELINAEIQNLRAKNDVYAAVYLVQTLDSASIEDAAFSTFNTWILGDAQKHNGLLFMFSINDRKARIEVGRGLEGDITDLYAKRLLDHSILPFFKSGEYGNGILNGLKGTAVLLDKTSSAEDIKSYIGSETNGNDINVARGARVYLGWLIILLGGFPLLTLLGNTSPKPNRKRSPVISKKSPFSLKKKKGISFFPTIFILIFCCINPGIFIFFLGGIDDLYIPIANLITKFKDTGALYLITGVLFGLPIVVKLISSQIGRTKGNKNPDLTREGLNYLIFILNLNSPVLPISIAFATLIVLVGIVLLDVIAVVGLTLIGLTGLLYCYLLYHTAKMLISPVAYTKSLAQERLNRIKFRVEGPREIFGKSHSYTRPSSNSGGRSYRSSSSSSSSSGGGRSSGGGASSSW